MPSVIDSLAQGWWSWMTAMAWQASLLIVLVGAADVALRRFAWPQFRYALWSLVLIKLLLPPTWTAPTGLVTNLRPWLHREVVARVVGAAPEPRPATEDEQGAATETVGQRDEAPAAGAGRPVEAGTEVASSVTVLAASVWFSGLVLMAALLWARIATLRRWHRLQKEKGTVPPWFHELLVATAERLGLDRLPAIVFSNKAVAPAVYGLLRPTLLLPRTYVNSLSRADAEHVLLHELAHIKRGDLWVNAAWLVVQVVYWFNPLVAWALREAKHVREMCCDVTVASVLREDTAAYRKTLLDTARELLTESLEPGMGLLGVFEEPFRLVARLRLLEKPAWKHRGAAAVVSIMAIGVLAPVLLPMAVARPRPGGFDEPAAAVAGRSSADSFRATSGEHLFVLEKVHTDDLILGVPVLSKAVGANTTWLGDDVFAATEGERTIVVDRGRDRFLFIDHHNRTYVDAPLDVDPESLLDEHVAERMASERTSGTVTDTGSSDRLLGRRCREYEVAIWRVWGESAGRPATARVWATTDVGVDLAAFDQFAEMLRRLYNRDETLRRELRKVRGLQIRYERVLGRRGLFSRRIVAETVEIDRRPVPPGTYDPPDGYRRVDRIVSLDP